MENIMRKLINIVEHNIGEYDHLSSDYILSKVSESKKIYAFAIRKNGGGSTQDLHRYVGEDDYSRIYFTIDHKSNEVSGYLQVIRFNDIWQEKGLYVFPQYRNVGLATDLYNFVIKHELIKMISDSQLTPDAERLWNALRRGMTIKIYDKELDKVYDYSEIGNMTDDGIEIIDPKNDESYSKERFDDNVRFFMLAESSEEVRKTMSESLKRRTDIQYYLEHGEPEIHPIIKERIMPRIPNFGREGEP